MEGPLSLLEVTNLTRGTMRLLATKQVNRIQVLLLKFFDWDAAAYAQWITDNDLQFMKAKGMMQTPRGYKVLWDIWKNAVRRQYETLVAIEDTMRIPGGGAAYIAVTKKLFAQMYREIPWANDAVAEPARMNWPRVILNLANREYVAAEWMIDKMEAGITMWARCKSSYEHHH